MFFDEKKTGVLFVEPETDKHLVMRFFFYCCRVCCFANRSKIIMLGGKTMLFAR